ncbi:Spy/CpxP family protein refolding chaperone [Dokdonella soli]|uniref:Signaling pathway modulator ZraP n=1 Tax=Dokdonella soli TaxID=529810 RepID=A0ABN1IS78_9GAMM
MKTHPEAPSTTQQGKLRFARRTATYALLACIAIGGTVAAVANNLDASGFHHGAMTAQDMSGHVDQMLQHLYAETAVSDAQKAQIEPLVKQAVTDLAPLHAQCHAAHATLLALFSADTIDRAAIESARSEQMHLFDQASQRIAQLVEDVSDVLTPAQRMTLATQLAQHLAAHG